MKKPRLRKKHVIETGRPGDVVITAFSPGHARRLLKRYLMEMRNVPEQRADYLAEKSEFVPRENYTLEEAERYANFIKDEYGVDLDPINWTAQVEAESEEKARQLLKRYLTEEWVYTEEETEKILETMEEGDEQR